MRKLPIRTLVLSAFVLVAFATPAAAQDTIPLTYPVDGPNVLTDSFGDCRGAGCSRSHEGVDIMAEKGVPVVAAADGVVTSVRGINKDGTVEPGGHQWLVIDHGGWQTRYLHLNNDTPGTDDGLGQGITDDIVAAYVASSGEGYSSSIAHPVSAGQLIGWVGDSGNAESTAPHLHFEIRIGEGWNAVAIDAYPHLVAGQMTMSTARAPAFGDIGDSVHRGDIEILAADGVTKGCNPPQNTLYCPQRQITRGEIAAFIARTLALPAATADHFTDDDHTVFNADINALMEAGIGFGCTETQFCPSQPLLRDEMAQMLVNAFADQYPDLYVNEAATDFFGDDSGNQYEEAINLLMAAGVTKGCNPPDNDQYCPQRALTRAEMASFFVRALGY